MKIKRFQAPDVRQAIKEVRSMLGPDAVILSNTRVDGGIEIVAATDYDENQFRRPVESEFNRRDEQPRVEINPTIEPTPKPGPKTLSENIWSQEPTLVQMRKEITSLKDMLQSQLSDLTWKDMKQRSPIQIQLLHRYLRMGVDMEIAKHITQQVHAVNDLETAWRQSLGRLATQIQMDKADVLNKGGIMALVGPTGVGKTTTIAKLAARYALKHGTRNVGLITADCYRIGGQEQLRSYARIIGVPVRVARDHEELDTALNELIDRGLILVDTAGMNQREINLTEKFSLLKQQSVHLKICLALSATTQTAGMDDIINAFSHLDLSACILTKTDEANSLGEAVSALIRHHLPLAYITNGQQVPEDLSLPRPGVLIRQASEMLADKQKLAPQTLSSYGGFAAYG